jgi:hypothetical protein
MSDERRPIDDPEVRQQHRRQVHSTLAVAGFYIGGWAVGIFVLVALALSGTHAFGTRAPAKVFEVDDVHSTVSVTSSDPRISGWLELDVRDTDAYAVGDQVGVIIEGEDHDVVSLDREPVVPLVLHTAAVIFGLAACVMAIATGFVELCARRQRRSLEHPWRRARVTVSKNGEGHRARIDDDHRVTTWELFDFPTGLAMNTPIDAQIAGSSRRLAVRFYGSTKLAFARRGRKDVLRPEPAQPTGVSAMSAPRCTSVGVSDPKSSSSCFASRK